MKTIIFSIVTLFFITISLNNQTFAATNSDRETVLTNVAKINKIEVHGNVQLYITSGDADKVKVYDSYYSQNALVQEQDGVLRISSYKNEKLVVWVTINDLRSVDAYDNADVETFGGFSALDFNLNLNNNATAKFDMDCYSSKIAVNDNARADISGTSFVSYVTVNQSATVNTAKLVAQQSVQKRIVPVTAAGSTATEEVGFN